MLFPSWNSRIQNHTIIVLHHYSISELNIMAMENDTKNKTRHLKVCAKWCASKDILRYKGKEVPWLNISGVWLHQAGFSIGDCVEIKVDRKKLIITCKAGEH